jgi:hypothetical protein
MQRFQRFCSIYFLFESGFYCAISLSFIYAPVDGIHWTEPSHYADSDMLKPRPRPPRRPDRIAPKPQGTRADEEVKERGDGEKQQERPELTEEQKEIALLEQDVRRILHY